MKIYIDQILEAGIDLHEVYDASSLDLNAPQVNFITPIETVAKVGKTIDTIFVQARIKAPIRIVCSRCLKERDVQFFKEFQSDYQIEKGQRILDITDDIRQEIILSYPIKPLCKVDCKGLCSVCGQNLNEGTCLHVR